MWQWVVGILLSGCIGCSASRSPATTPTTEVIAATALRSTVLVRTQLGAGTGFCIDPGLIVTSFHIVAGEPVMAVRETTDIEHPVMGIRIYDEASDLAFLHVPSARVPPLKLAPPGRPQSVRRSWS